MTKWEEWKKAVGETRPWHLLDSSKYVSDLKIAEDRYNICLLCPELTEHTNQCKKCGCFMAAKTKLENAKCPLGKW